MPKSTKNIIILIGVSTKGLTRLSSTESDKSFSLFIIFKIKSEIASILPFFTSLAFEPKSSGIVSAIFSVEVRIVPNPTVLRILAAIT